MLFSVIIPTYNRAALLREALDSVFAQEFMDYEVVVVDDGSTDDTEDVCRRFGGRVRLFRQKNKGPGAARNLAVTHANGDYIAFLDSDDLWFPWTLSTYASVIRTNGYPSMVSGNWVTFWENAPKVEEKVIQATTFEHLLEACSDTMPPVGGTPSIAVRTCSFIRLGGFCEMPINGEDTDLWLRLGLEPGFVRIHCPLVCAQRIHADNVTKAMEKAIDGVHYQIRQEIAGAYPGDASHRTKRIKILAASARNVSLESKRTGHLREALLLYVKTVYWQIRLLRIRYVLGFPLLMIAEWFRTRARP